MSSVCQKLKNYSKSTICFALCSWACSSTFALAQNVELDPFKNLTVKTKLSILSGSISDSDFLNAVINVVKTASQGFQNEEAWDQDLLGLVKSFNFPTFPGDLAIITGLLSDPNAAVLTKCEVREGNFYPTRQGYYVKGSSKIHICRNSLPFKQRRLLDVANTVFHESYHYVQHKRKRKFYEGEVEKEAVEANLILNALYAWPENDFYLDGTLVKEKFEANVFSGVYFYMVINNKSFEKKLLHDIKKGDVFDFHPDFAEVLRWGPELNKFSTFSATLYITIKDNEALPKTGSVVQSPVWYASLGTESEPSEETVIVDFSTGKSNYFFTFSTDLPVGFAHPYLPIKVLESMTLGLLKFRETPKPL